MQYIKLGTSDLSVSRICLGCMGFGDAKNGQHSWWGQAPKIMYTFLESYDFTGKTIVPFCTSGSSGIGSSATDLESSAGSAAWLSGRRFSGSDSQSAVADWVNGLEMIGASDPFGSRSLS